MSEAREMEKQARKFVDDYMRECRGVPGADSILMKAFSWPFQDRLIATLQSAYLQGRKDMREEAAALAEGVRDWHGKMQTDGPVEELKDRKAAKYATEGLASAIRNLKEGKGQMGDTQPTGETVAELMDGLLQFHDLDKMMPEVRLDPQANRFTFWMVKRKGYQNGPVYLGKVSKDFGSMDEIRAEIDEWKASPNGLAAMSKSQQKQ